MLRLFADRREMEDFVLLRLTSHKWGVQVKTNRFAKVCPSANSGSFRPNGRISYHRNHISARGARADNLVQIRTTMKWVQKTSASISANCRVKTHVGPLSQSTPCCGREFA